MVSIIGISAALAAPTMMRAMAQRRASEASHSVVRIGARARSEALAYGRAHVLVFSEASGSGSSLGSLTLWRGRIDRCSANDWGTIITGACSASPDCIDSVDFGIYDYPTHKVRLRLPGGTAGALCFQPDGDSYFAGAVGAVWRITPPAGIEGVRFILERMENGVVVGVQRAVVFPFGGSPRIAR